MKIFVKEKCAMDDVIIIVSFKTGLLDKLLTEKITKYVVAFTTFEARNLRYTYQLFQKEANILVSP